MNTQGVNQWFTTASARTASGGSITLSRLAAMAWSMYKTARVKLASTFQYHYRRKYESTSISNKDKHRTF
jgi:hypothetical protein